MITLNQHRLPIEQYAILTENAPALGGKLEWWYDFYQPATPGECALVDMAVMASIQQQRVLGCLTETVNQQVRTAVFHFDCDQEDEVQRYRDMLETRPGVAVVGLKRSALGTRFLIGRWERLLGLLQTEGTLYGNDRNEAIHYQGARATKPENLFESEGAYMTWLYCLMAQPAPKDEDFVHIGNINFMPKGLDDRPTEQWTGTAEHCRQLLVELAERELAQLRPREEVLRVNYEVPARDGAEVRNQVLQGPIGARLLRESDTHKRHFRQAYDAFLKGRARTEKSGRLPGAPMEEVHGEPVVKTAAVAPDPGAVEKGRAERREAAAKVAPGEENGIGAGIPRGDIERSAVRATNPMSMAEMEAACRQAEEEAARAGAQ